MGFFETFKKLFSPIKVIPRAYFQNMLEAVYLSTYLIFTMEIFKLILGSIEYGQKQDFKILLSIYFVISFFVGIIRFTMYKMGWVDIMYEGRKVWYKIYLEKFIQAEGNQVEKIGTGRFISLLDKGIHEWLDMTFYLTFYGLQSLIFILYAIFSILRVSFFGGLISLLLILIGGYVATKANIFMRDKRMLRRKAENEANHQAVIALMSKNELMQNNGLKTILGKIFTHFDEAKEYHHPVNVGFLIIDEFPKFMFLLIRIGVYIYLYSQILLHKSSFSELAIFITILSLMELSMNNFLHSLRDVLRQISGVQLLWETFENLTPIKGFNTGNIFKSRTDKIILKNISYGYTDKKVFDNFSLIIEGNKKTAFVGLSGSGKTTLMKLIAGYLRPQEGILDIFGNDLSKTSLKSYFTEIGYLTQEPSVFDGTIRENLEASVKGKVSEKAMKEALKDAMCDFVFEFEKGLDTEIGEKGIRLSGGQRQRLAIAKIFIKDPEIILLDEPTSALDSFSEEKITEAMHRLFEGRTVIIIAHRLQTVKEADDIIVLENGDVVERGTHKELIKKKGIYNKMLELQSGF
nr:ABC transporter ATP-binding protein/permease [Candidatus Gracilibacteria bacterium]